MKCRIKCRIPGQSSIGGTGKRVRLAFLVGVGLLASPAAAQDATWLASPGSNDFNAGANWSTGSLPTGTASFGASNTTALSLSAVTTLGALQFDAGAPAYTFTAAITLNLTGAGIVNNSSNAPAFAVYTAGLNFYGSSTAANAIITTGTTNAFGYVSFQNTSNAGNATINNAFGAVNFLDASTAGNATIVNGSGSSLTFNGGATAGNATIISNNGGTTLFAGSSTAGAARLIANAGGIVDFSWGAGPSNDNKLSAGSLEGAGNFYLGANQLTVGGNNLSTTVSGVISDCGAGTDCGNSGATGGGLVKVGSGTLVLAGTDSYTGGTTVSAGTLFVSGSIAASATTVASGGTLAGTGTVGGVTVNSGGIFAPGDGTAGSSLNVSGNLALQSGAIYLVQVNPSGSFASVTGIATLGGATVNAIYANGSYVSRRYTILSATGGLSGTFNALVDTNLPSNFTASLGYDASNAYLDLHLNFGLPSGLNGNQQAVGNALTTYFNSTGGIPMVYGALDAQGLSQASGELATGTQQATFDAMNLFMGVMTDPFSARVRGGVDLGSTAYSEADAVAYAGRRKPNDALAAITKAPPRFEAGLERMGGRLRRNANHRRQRHGGISCRDQPRVRHGCRRRLPLLAQHPCRLCAGRRWHELQRRQ